MPLCKLLIDKLQGEAAVCGKFRGVQNKVVGHAPFGAPDAVIFAVVLRNKPVCPGKRQNFFDELVVLNLSVDVIAYGFGRDAAFLIKVHYGQVHTLQGFDV